MSLTALTHAGLVCRSFSAKRSAQKGRDYLDSFKFLEIANLERCGKYRFPPWYRHQILALETPPHLQYELEHRSGGEHEIIHISSHGPFYHLSFKSKRIVSEGSGMTHFETVQTPDRRPTA